MPSSLPASAMRLVISMSARLGSGEPEARTKAREAWEQWEKKHGEKADLARADDLRRLLGLTLAIEYNTARIWECGPDGTIRWEIANLKGPMEAWILPGNRVLLADGNDVTERDLKGAILRTFSVGGSGPTGSNGNSLHCGHGTCWPACTNRIVLAAPSAFSSGFTARCSSNIAPFP